MRGISHIYFAVEILCFLDATIAMQVFGKKQMMSDQTIEVMYCSLNASTLQSVLEGLETSKVVSAQETAAKNSSFFTSKEELLQPCLDTHKNLLFCTTTTQKDPSFCW